MLHISLKIHIDTEKRQYLTSKVNALFSVKRSSSNEKKDIKKGLPIKSDEESSLVDPAVPFSNHFYKNLTEIYDLKDMLWSEGIISYDDLCLTITEVST